MTTTVDPPTRPDPRTEVDLESLPTERLEHEMLSLAGHLAAATCSFLRMVGEYDARRSWESWECLSCAHWLNWRCGVGMVAAREQVRVARRLRELPLVTEAFDRGELSYSKVRAITRVAHPGTEANLVDLARWSTASQLERACSALRRCSEQADAELRDEQDRAELRRSLTWSHDLDTGDLIVRARIPAGVAAESFRASIDALADALAEPTLAPDDPEALALECRRLDALVDLVSAGATCDTSLAPQPEVVVHVTAPVQAAAPDHDAPATRAVHDAAHRWPIVTQHDQHLPWATLHKLCCDGGARSVLDLVDGDGLWADLVTSLDLDRHRRFPSPALRRAVHRRDRGCCRFPGCARRHRLHVHHIVWWERGGRTDLSNLTRCEDAPRRLGPVRRSRAGGLAARPEGRYGVDLPAISRRPPFGPPSLIQTGGAALPPSVQMPSILCAAGRRRGCLSGLASLQVWWVLCWRWSSTSALGLPPSPCRPSAVGS
jgi:hypothetical protein